MEEKENEDDVNDDDEIDDDENESIADDVRLAMTNYLFSKHIYIKTKMFFNFSVASVASVESSNTPQNTTPNQSTIKQTPKVPQSSSKIPQPSSKSVVPVAMATNNTTRLPSNAQKPTNSSRNSLNSRVSASSTPLRKSSGERLRLNQRKAVKSSNMPPRPERTYEF